MKGSMTGVGIRIYTKNERKQMEIDDLKRNYIN